MRQLLSIFFTITMLMVLGVSCVEDRELVLPSQGEQPGGEDNKNDDENKEDEGADDGTEDEKGDDTDDGKEEPPIYNDYPNTSWAQGENVCVAPFGNYKEGYYKSVWSLVLDLSWTEKLRVSLSLALSCLCRRVVPVWCTSLRSLTLMSARSLSI